MSEAVSREDGQPGVGMLRLIAVRGPEIPPIDLTRSGGIIGRSSASEVRLSDPTISRRHASISWAGGRWLLTDLGGANGTWLNDVRLEQAIPAPLAAGDRISCGPWVLLVGSWSPTTVSMDSAIDGPESSVRIKKVDPTQAGRLAHQRLGALIDCAGRLNEAEDEKQLAETILESVIEGTGYGRAALVRMAGRDDEVEILGYRARTEGGPESFSRSLMVRATEGEIVTLVAQQQQEGNWGQSIADLEIHSALCCPVKVDDLVAACLYLDARGGEADVKADAAGFVEAISRLSGLAMANLRRRDLQARQRDLEQEMAAAREAQQLMVPVEQKGSSIIEYAVEFHPGRVASGDLFDVVDLPDDRVAVILGDVSGKGVGAAILMAAAQSYLHGALARYGQPAAAVNALNEFIIDRSASNRFLTLWVGVFDADGTLHYVDGGHGHWGICHADGSVEMRGVATSPLVGALEAMEYEEHQLTLSAGDRVVLMTDGVPEQPDAEGEQFTLERAGECLGKTRTCREDVVELLAAVRAWSGTSSLADDTTVASISARLEP